MVAHGSWTRTELKILVPGRLICSHHVSTPIRLTIRTAAFLIHVLCFFCVFSDLERLGGAEVFFVISSWRVRLREVTAKSFGTSLIAAVVIKDTPTGEDHRKLLFRSYLSDSNALKLDLILDSSAAIVLIASVIAASVMVGPNRNIFFSKGRAK